MRTDRSSYVHFGDRARRAARIRRSIYAAGAVLLLAPIVAMRDAQDANAEEDSTFRVGARRDVTRLRDSMHLLRGELDLASLQLERARAIIRFSSRYRIPADLAGDIFDVSQAEGIQPELAFRLVKLESDFNERATSPVGAIGLTQLMMNTAVDYQRGLTREKLYDRHTNLRIGFRHLRALLARYDGDVRLALLVYNRGEGAVRSSRLAGRNPSNGYDRKIMRGYSGSAIVD
jgi:soluble lytic murein transglycosylase-like protein